MKDRLPLKHLSFCLDFFSRFYFVSVLPFKILSVQSSVPLPTLLYYSECRLTVGSPLLSPLAHFHYELLCRLLKSFGYVVRSGPFVCFIGYPIHFCLENVTETLYRLLTFLSYENITRTIFSV